MGLAEQLEQVKEELAYYKGLSAPHRSDVPPAWKLSKGESRIAACIITRIRPSMGALIEWMYVGEDEPDDPENTIYVLICRLRKKVAKHGVKLVSHYGEGYSFDPQLKGD